MIGDGTVITSARTRPLMLGSGTPPLPLVACQEFFNVSQVVVRDPLRPLEAHVADEAETYTPSSLLSKSSSGVTVTPVWPAI